MDREDRDELDDGGGRAALVIGFGEKESDSELPTLMRALGRALRAGDWERAAKVFEEAMHVCDDQADDDQGDDDEHREKNNDREDDLVY
jgi:hypothetical protein